ncbi:hypothetical protein BH11ARM1_BH11ARM1_15210 [soil metagenome]
MKKLPLLIFLIAGCGVAVYGITTRHGGEHPLSSRTHIFTPEQLRAVEKINREVSRLEGVRLD